MGSDDSRVRGLQIRGKIGGVRSGTRASASGVFLGTIDARNVRRIGKWDNRK